MDRQIEIVQTQLLPGIKTGDCLLVSGTSFLAHEIQSFEKCVWNHAAMFRWDNDVLYVWEASMKGMIITPFAEYTQNLKEGLLIMKPKFPVNESDYINFVLPYIGHTNYGFFDLLVAQAVRFLTKKKIWFGSKKDPAVHHFTCGEFVAFVYNHFNPTKFDTWNQMAPSDLFDADCFDKFVYQ